MQTKIKTVRRSESCCWKDIHDLNGIHCYWRNAATVALVVHNNHEQVAAGNLLYDKGSVVRTLADVKIPGSGQQDEHSQFQTQQCCVSTWRSPHSRCCLLFLWWCVQRWRRDTPYRKVPSRFYLEFSELYGQGNRQNLTKHWQKLTKTTNTRGMIVHQHPVDQDSPQLHGIFCVTCKNLSKHVCSVVKLITELVKLCLKKWFLCLTFPDIGETRSSLLRRSRAV